MWWENALSTRDEIHGLRRQLTFVDTKRPPSGGLRKRGASVNSRPRIPQYDIRIAIRAGADHRQRAPYEFFLRTQLGAGGGGELVPLGDAVGVFFPAR
jgi:hypothetical protein